MRTNKPTDAPPAAKKLRRYDEAYLQFGFTVTADLRPQCVVCAEVLANDSMKPCKLKRPSKQSMLALKINRLNILKESLMASISNRQPFQCTALCLNVFGGIVCSGQRIGKLGKPHTIAETLILPAAQDMCE